MIKAFKAKVLVIDNEEDIREILRERLEAREYRVLTAESGEEGLEAIAKEEPDLIFLDLKMPEMDGLEVLRKLPDPDRLPVIMITAYGSVEEAVEAMKQGAFDFIKCCAATSI